jgi:hypothetical protein
MAAPTAITWFLPQNKTNYMKFAEKNQQFYCRCVRKKLSF